MELKDYFNLCRSGGFRPGLEVLNIKKKDFQYLTDAKNPKLKVLEFTVYNTKTKCSFYRIYIWKKHKQRRKLTCLAKLLN